MTDDTSYKDEQESGGSSSKPPSFLEFFENNSELFTVVSVFGALAVYLTQLRESLSTAVKSGVGAVLVLFALSSGVALWHTYYRLAEARRAKMYFRTTIYATIMYSFLILLISILGIMARRFPEGSGGAIAAGLLYGGIFIYISFVFNSGIFLQYDWIFLRRVPYISAGILGLLIAMLWWMGSAPTIIYESYAKTLGSIGGLIFLHLTLTVIAFVVFRLINRYISKIDLRGIISTWRSEDD